ncbi:MAG: class III signal peptide-containing protein [Candidatus Diapherotrites archaeon]
MPQARNSRAQGSMEYLLLIGGVVLVAVIAILLIMQTSKSAGSEVNAAAEGGVAKIKEEAGIALGGPGTVAKLDAGKIGAPTVTADLSGLATGVFTPPAGGVSDGTGNGSGNGDGGSGNGNGNGGGNGGSSASFTFNQGGDYFIEAFYEVKTQ